MNIEEIIYCFRMIDDHQNTQILTVFIKTYYMDEQN